MTKHWQRKKFPSAWSLPSRKAGKKSEKIMQINVKTFVFPKFIGLLSRVDCGTESSLSRKVREPLKRALDRNEMRLATISSYFIRKLSDFLGALLHTIERCLWFEPNDMLRDSFHRTSIHYWRLRFDCQQNVVKSSGGYQWLYAQRSHRQHDYAKSHLKSSFRQSINVNDPRA